MDYQGDSKVLGLRHLLWWVSEAITMLSKPVVATKQIMHSPMSTCKVISMRLLISMSSMPLMLLNTAMYHIDFWTPIIPLIYCYVTPAPAVVFCFEYSP